MRRLTVQNGDIDGDGGTKIDLADSRDVLLREQSKMEDGLLSLKWNNHKSTFFHILNEVRGK
ncbi:hypothetical protein SK128_028475, partial [Halocaridina rubra]